MKGKFSLNRILHNNRLIMLISLLLAVILWVTVLYGSGNDEDLTVSLGAVSLKLTDYCLLYTSFTRATSSSGLKGLVR